MKDGIYEEIINSKILEELNNNSNLVFKKEKLDSEEAKFILTNYISEITKKSLKYLREDCKEEKEYLLKQIKICNDIIDLLKEKLNVNEFEKLKIDDSAEVLLYVYNNINNINYSNKVIRPDTSISRTSLFTGSKSEPCLQEEIKKEILSCDEVCMIVSFIKWSGLLKIMDELKEYTDSGKKLRVITTSYMGQLILKLLSLYLN